MHFNLWWLARSGSPFPLNLQLAMVHWTLVAGACARTIGASAGVEATHLYPDMKFVTVDEYLGGLLSAS